jgi:hypothetical protein
VAFDVGNSSEDVGVGPGRFTATCGGLTTADIPCSADTRRTSADATEPLKLKSSPMGLTTRGAEFHRRKLSQWQSSGEPRRPEGSAIKSGSAARTAESVRGRFEHARPPRCTSASCSLSETAEVAWTRGPYGFRSPTG